MILISLQSSFRVTLHLHIRSPSATTLLLSDILGRFPLRRSIRLRLVWLLLDWVFPVSRKRRFPTVIQSEEWVVTLSCQLHFLPCRVSSARFPCQRFATTLHGLEESTSGNLAACSSLPTKPPARSTISISQPSDWAGSRRVWTPRRETSDRAISFKILRPSANGIQRFRSCSAGSHRCPRTLITRGTAQRKTPGPGERATIATSNTSFMDKTSGT